MESLLRSLIYGDSGSGKTYLVGTATCDERSRPLLVLNARGQPITLRLFSSPPLVIDVSEMSDFNAPYEWIMAGQEWKWIEQYRKVGKGSRAQFASAVYDYFEGEPGSFKAVSVDSVTWVQRVSLSQIAGNQTVMPGDMPARTQIQHWGQTLAQLTNLCDLYFQLPVHVIITALTRHDRIEAMGQTMFYPFLWGQSSLEIPSLAELVGRLMPLESVDASTAMAFRKDVPTEWANAWNVLLTKGGRNYMAKWQGVLNNPEAMLDPTVAKLLDNLPT